MRTARTLSIATCLITFALGQAALNAQGAYDSGVTIGWLPNVVGIAAFRNLDDGYEAVLAASSNGEVHEYFYWPGYPWSSGDSVIAHVDGIVALSGFYAKDDHNRIAIAADRYGNVHEIYYHPDWGIGRSVIAQFPWSQIVSISAFYHDYDAHRIVFVGLADGNVFEVNYHQSTGIRVAWRYHAGPGLLLSVAGYTVTNPCAGYTVCTPSVWVLLVGSRCKYYYDCPFVDSYSTYIHVVSITPTRVGTPVVYGRVGRATSMAANQFDLFAAATAYGSTELYFWRLESWGTWKAGNGRLVAMGPSRTSRAWVRSYAPGWDAIVVRSPWVY